jgi:hypothetical protein
MFAAVSRPDAVGDPEVADVCIVEAAMQARQGMEGLLSGFDSWAVTQGKREDEANARM